jgi:hypothetical protein
MPGQPTNGDIPWRRRGCCRSRYVIGVDGIIAYSEVNPDYTQRPDPSELPPMLDRLSASKAA